jgi:hypothetical protein
MRVCATPPPCRGPQDMAGPEFLSTDHCLLQIINSRCRTIEISRGPYEEMSTQHAENHPRGTAPPFSQIAFKLKNAFLQVIL